MITYDDFMKVELRVATVLAAERVEGAARLLKLRVKIGEEERTLAAGIAEHYSPEELVGKQLIVVANLEPKKLRGIESNGMLLAACTDDESQIVFVTPEKQIPDGSRVR
ncbi:methionine--tRNA ligase subunit beta [Candidatus Micrarchaeota archaeon CG10_big_fil_rev_8_21_14_0_10_59_7]|nr:MAG: methionine--tRNA ligase subunit beta [Candidatus Micrarchaeota archaeon CG10_big_fil_rev_8_21_14_0_10_59_7]